MDEPPIQKQTDGRNWVRIAGLFLAFIPSALILFLIKNSNANNLKNTVAAAFTFTVICSFASSFMLFRRGTVWSIVFGVIFLILNLVISLFLGCVAAFSY